MIRYDVIVRSPDIELRGFIDGIELVQQFAAAISDTPTTMLVSVSVNQPDGPLPAGAVQPTGALQEVNMADGSTLTVSTAFEEVPE